MPLDDDTLQRLIAQLGEAEPLKRWEAADTSAVAKSESSMLPIAVFS
jgi:hypothetical protein